MASTSPSTSTSNPQVDPETPAGSKPCTLCHTPRQILIRCQIDEAGEWHFVCPGKCWYSVSGGVEDARGVEGLYPWYRYGGMWKNKHAYGPVSAKKPRKVKERQRQMARENHENAHSDEEDEGVDEEHSTPPSSNVKKRPKKNSGKANDDGNRDISVAGGRRNINVEASDSDLVEDEISS